MVYLLLITVGIVSRLPSLIGEVWAQTGWTKIPADK
jgi:hypothetical protein